MMSRTAVDWATYSLLTLIVSGQWCGSVGRAVASETRGPRFESSHLQILY